MKTTTTMRRIPECGTDATRTSQSNRGATALPINEVLVGDAREQLRRLASESIDCVMTSPPYHLLRRYNGGKHEIGGTISIGDYVAEIASVMREVRRILKPSGSVWLNLGDSFSRAEQYGAPPKSLLLGPERIALALSDDGWTIRGKVIWAKRNPMPTSAKDRLACTWEPIFHLTKGRDYFFDLDAIRQTCSGPGQQRCRPPKNVTPAGRRAPSKEPWRGPLAGNQSGLAQMRGRGLSGHVLGKNPGDVWRLSTSGFRSDHHAAFPPELVERPILSTCPEAVCATCGLLWRRSPLPQMLGSLAIRGVLRKSCGCEKRDHEPGVVLDPFIGAGTTGLVAERLKRRWIGIELNPSFAQLARDRISSDLVMASGGIR